MTEARPTQPRLRRLMATLVPPPEMPTAMVVQTLTYSIGSGFFMSGSVIFFTVYAGLTAVQVASGMSIAGIAALVCRIPIGVASDRLGGKRTWFVGAIAQAALFACYPLVKSFGLFVVIVTLTGLGAVIGGSGRGRYLAEIMPPGRRVAANAYMRSVLNVGFAIGTAAAGLLVSLSSTAMVLLVLVNAASFVFDAVLLIFFMPGEWGPSVKKLRPTGGRAWTDRPFVILSLITSVFALDETILAVVLPLWILRDTGAPRALIPAALLANMIMASVLQVWASGGAHDVTGSARAQTKAGWYAASACVVVSFSHGAGGVMAALVIGVAVIAFTCCELFSSASAWGFSYGLGSEDRRAEYLAVFGWGNQLAGVVSPLTLTALALSFVPYGWFVIAAIFLAAGLATGPVASWALRSQPAPAGTEILDQTAVDADELPPIAADLLTHPSSD